MSEVVDGQYQYIFSSPELLLTGLMSFKVLLCVSDWLV